MRLFTYCLVLACFVSACGAVEHERDAAPFHWLLGDWGWMGADEGTLQCWELTGAELHAGVTTWGYPMPPTGSVHRIRRRAGTWVYQTDFDRRVHRFLTYRLVELGPRWAVFARGDDRIVYARTRDILEVEISGGRERLALLGARCADMSDERRDRAHGSDLGPVEEPVPLEEFDVPAAHKESQQTHGRQR